VNRIVAYSVSFVLFFVEGLSVFSSGRIMMWRLWWKIHYCLLCHKTLHHSSFKLPWTLVWNG